MHTPSELPKKVSFYSLGSCSISIAWLAHSRSARVVFCANFMNNWLSAPTLFELVALCALGNCRRIVFLFSPNFELGGSLCLVFSQGFELFSCWYHAQTLKSRVSNLWPLWGLCARTTNWPTMLFKTFLIFKP